MRPCCPLVRLGPPRELEPRLAQGRGAPILDRHPVRHHVHVGRRAVAVRDEHGLMVLEAERPQARPGGGHHLGLRGGPLIRRPGQRVVRHGFLQAAAAGADARKILEFVGVGHRRRHLPRRHAGIVGGQIHRLGPRHA